MLSRLKRVVFRPVGYAAVAMALLASGCGGGGPLESEQVFSDNVFSGNHLKPKDYPIHGIDVSKFQGDIDWSAVAKSGIVATPSTEKTSSRRSAPSATRDRYS